MSADTVISDQTNPQSLNRFAYVLNNPIRFNDPTGHVCSDPEDPSPTCDGSTVLETKVGDRMILGTGLDAGKLKNPIVSVESGSGGNPDFGHEYWALNPICADFFWINCTDAEAYDYMSRWQYPGQLFWQPWQDGQTYNVFPGRIGNIPLVDLFYPGSGRIYGRFSGGTLSNIAYPSHIFYEGRVDRTPIRFNGVPFVVTHGTGTNDGFHLGSFRINNWTLDIGLQGSWIDAANNKVGTAAFGIQDAGMLTYTTVVETWQYITGTQQSP